MAAEEIGGERDLDIEILKEVAAKKMVSAPVRRQQVPTYVNVGDRFDELARCYQCPGQRWVMIESCAERCTGAQGNARARGAIPALWISTNPGFLGKTGPVMSADRVHRIWRDAGLQVPRKRPRRRVAGGRPRPYRLSEPITCGLTTLCSMPAPTVNN